MKYNGTIRPHNGGHILNSAELLRTTPANRCRTDDEFFKKTPADTSPHQRCIPQLSGIHQSPVAWLDRASRLWRGRSSTVAATPSAMPTFYRTVPFTRCIRLAGTLVKKLNSASEPTATTADTFKPRAEPEARGCLPQHPLMAMRATDNKTSDNSCCN